MKRNQITPIIILIIILCAVTINNSKSQIAKSNIAVSFSIDSKQITGKINEDIYGHFLEQLYHSTSNGLWGELVWNRSFEEATPVNRNPNSQETLASSTKIETPAVTSPARQWLNAGGAVIALDTNNPVNSRHSLHIITSGGEQGVSQAGFCLKKGDIIQGSLWLRGTAPGGIIVRLINGSTILAKQILTEPGIEWAEFPLTLAPAETADSAVLQIVSSGKASVWVDQVCLMPNSFKANGGFRTDLLKAVADLKPASIRWPGGGFVNMYNWKDAIGPQVKRKDKGRVNWDEIDPLSFGIDEFMLLCKKTGAEPVVVIYMGPRNQTKPDPYYIREALDELDYCNGPATSEWGKVRAANGHPEPYNVKYWEIDNEIYLTSMSAPVYLTIVKAYSDALKKMDPSVKIIGSGGGGTNMYTDREWQLRILEGDQTSWDLSSIHQYENYSRGGDDNKDSKKFYTGISDFDKHFNDLFQRISKSSNPNLKLYVSEWNYMSTDWRTGLYAGGVLNSMERNSNIVSMACPALFLRHVSATGWDNAFINFDNRSWFPAPNYVVMKLYRDHLAPNRVALNGETGDLNIIASISEDKKNLYLKIVNPVDKTIEVVLNINKDFKIKKAVLHLVAPGDLLSRNTMDSKEVVSPVDKELTAKGNVIRLTLPRWSVGVIDLTGK